MKRGHKIRSSRVKERLAIVTGNQHIIMFCSIFFYPSSAVKYFSQQIFQPPTLAPKETMFSPHRLASVLALYWGCFGPLKPLDFSGFIATQMVFTVSLMSALKYSLTSWIMDRAVICLVKLKRFHWQHPHISHWVYELKGLAVTTSTG